LETNRQAADGVRPARSAIVDSSRSLSIGFVIDDDGRRARSPGGGGDDCSEPVGVRVRGVTVRRPSMTMIVDELASSNGRVLLQEPTRRGRAAARSSAE
jgi:hypothetical protein